MSHELITVTEAQDLIAAAMPSFGAEAVPLAAAAGRILRQPVFAEHDHPPFDRVMMDGIAVRWRDPMPTSFVLAGFQMAGMTPREPSLEDGCIEVATGAVLPAGSDCVIPVEQVRREGDVFHLAAGQLPRRRQFIHAQGSDCRQGARVLDAGMLVRGPEMALLAANGLAQVRVASRPSVAVVSTGDELVPVDAPLKPGHIRRSNDVAIAAALELEGLADVTRHHVHDDAEATLALIQHLLFSHEVLVLSGGVSMGKRDHVPGALEALGVRRVFHRIAQKPGKPMWFGVGPKGQAVFALPGNPVSALVCTVRYVRPALARAMGADLKPAERVFLAVPAERHDVLSVFVPVQLHPDASGRLVAELVPAQTSGDFVSLPHTHGFVQLPPGKAPTRVGAVVDFFRW